MNHFPLLQLLRTILHFPTLLHSSLHFPTLLRIIPPPSLTLPIVPDPFQSFLFVILLLVQFPSLICPGPSLDNKPLLDLFHPHPLSFIVKYSSIIFVAFWYILYHLNQFGRPLSLALWPWPKSDICPLSPLKCPVVKNHSYFFKLNYGPIQYINK